MRSSLRAAILTVVPAAFAAFAFLQDDEGKFNQGQADRLNKFAKTAHKQGFPRQARLIWMQVTKLYNPDDAEARKGLGYIKSGASWILDPKAETVQPDTGTGADGTALFKAYEKLKEELAAAHRKQAQFWAKSQRTDKSRHHYQMVLRWMKDDKEAQQALEHHEVGGVTGTDLEQTVYERSKAIERAVTEQATKSYPAEKVESPSPILDHAQVKYISLASEHFVLHGDADQEEHLKTALMWGERALCVMEVAFPWKTDVKGKWAYFVSDDTYKQILKAHGDKIPDLAWRLEHTKSCGIGDTVVGATGSTQILFDAAVRNVAQAWAGFGSDGLREGIGHTFVGMVFNNNRLFSVDLKKQERTTASEEDREYTSPNFDVWKTLALEMAWKLTGGVPAMDLPFCDAATLTNEQRIKAWSFCDYVMRRDPELLRKLDRIGVEYERTKVKRPVEGAEKFATDAGVTVAQLDKEWEDFWTEATPVLQAIRANTPPLKAISPGVEKWLAAFNDARAKNKANLVTWSSQLSTRCYEHALYLKTNKEQRGPAAEHKQLGELGGTHLGNMFAQMAVVETDAKLASAKKMFEGWLSIPGYRDALVHDFLLSVGIYTEGDLLVMNVVAGLGAPKTKKSGFLCYPWKEATGIPTEVAVADIGPELEEFLTKHGQAGKKVVGFPLTIHFGNNVQGDRTSYRCNVTDARRKKIEGAILPDSGIIRRTTAPGMLTFYPFEPLPHGEIDATWSWEQNDQAQTLTARFTTK